MNGIVQDVSDVSQLVAIETATGRFTIARPHGPGLLRGRRVEGALDSIGECILAIGALRAPVSVHILAVDVDGDDAAAWMDKRWSW